MPDLSAALAALLPHSLGPYLGLVLAGFAVGILGHLTGSRRLVAVGVGLIFVGALLLPLVLNLSEDSPPRLQSPGR